MENDNLIEFTSPSNSPQYHSVLTRTSPSIISSNPFDEPPVVKATQQFVSPSKINFEDFKCDFLCRETIGRESLLLKSNDYGRESLGIIDLDDLDIGRPSLGIERLKIMKKSLNNSDNDILNEALLYSPEDLNETTVFSTKTNPSFNSNSLNTSLFSISSIKVADLTTTNILNKRLYNSGEFYDRLKFPKFNHLNRITSLPESLTIKEDDEELLTSKLWNSAITSNKSSDDLDPILIEARLIADHIADGSIFNEALDNIYTVEFTTEPKLVDISYENSGETAQKSDEIRNESNQHNSNSLTKDPRELLHSLSEILNTNNQQNSEGQILLNSLANILLSKSNSPQSSDDNNNSNNSKNNRNNSGNSSSIENQQQQQQQQQLNECYDEVLDLRLKTSQDDSKSNSSSDVPLDLSIKSKEHEFVQPKIILSKSSDKQQKNLTNNSNLSKFSFTTNNSNNGSISNNNNNSSLKIKKNEEKRKTGPLKAVIPIDNMMKTPVLYNATTPTTETKLKKTSTPINELKMRPVAQSTPDTPSNNKWKYSPLQSSDHQQQQQTDCKNRLNYSDSNLSSDHSKSMNKSGDNRRLRYSWNDEDQQKQQQPKSFLQRRSLSDLKRPQVSKYDQQQQQHHSIPRSYSAGKDPKILSSIKRVRQNINKNDNKSKGLYRSCSTEEKVSQNSDKTKINQKRDQALNENTTRVGTNNRKSVVMVRKSTGKENSNR